MYFFDDFFAKFNNQRASIELLNYVSRVINYTQMNDFETQYSKLIQEYQTGSTRLLSSIEVDRLDSFKEWSAIALNNKQNIFPLLVCKMIKGDIFALNIYENLRKLSDNYDLIIDYRKIHQSFDLQEKFKQHGAAEDGRAVMNAEYWLASEEAVSMLGQNELGHNSLCLVNSILHVANQYLHCGE